MDNLPVTVGQDLFFDPVVFEHAQRVAKLFTASTMVPQHFQTEKNIGNVLIAMNYASRCKADIFMVMQNMYVVHGKPGIESKLAIALLNSSGKFTPLRYDYNDDKTECTAYANDIKTGQECRGITVSMQMADKEGWTKKQGSKWLTMPELMLMYRSAIFFIRAYAPEVLLGMQTKEEIHDTLDMEKSGGVYQKAFDGEQKVTGTEIYQDENEKLKQPFPFDEKVIKFKRAGKFGIDMHLDEWTGLAQHFIENTSCWNDATEAQKNFAIDKWNTVYPDVPFDFILGVMFPPEVADNVIDIPKEKGDIVTTPETIEAKRKEVAQGKEAFPDIFDQVTETLIGKHEIRSKDIDTFTLHESSVVLKAMNEEIDARDANDNLS